MESKSENTTTISLAGNGHELQQLAEGINALNEFLLGLNDLPEKVRKGMIALSSLSRAVTQSVSAKGPVQIVITKGSTTTVHLESMIGLFRLTRPDELAAILKNVYLEMTQEEPAFKQPNFSENMRALHDLITNLEKTDYITSQNEHENELQTPK